MELHSIDLVIQAYHIYQDIWAAPIGAVLCRERESFNPSDPYAVAMLHDGAVVGHVPHIISAVCSAFLRRGGAIESEVTGTRQYSADLPQGGMEVPCKLTFTASSKKINKLHKLLSLADFKQTSFIADENLNKPDITFVPTISINPIGTLGTSSLAIKPEPADLQSDQFDHEPLDEPLKKKSRIDSNSDSSIAEDIWLKFGKNILTWVDREAICNGKQVNDHHINYCQCLLKRQFPTLGGLMLTLLQSS